MVCGRGTQSILRAHGRWLAWSSGPSTSPLGVVLDSRVVGLGAVTIGAYLLLALRPLIGRYLRNQPAGGRTGAKEPAFTPNVANDTDVICKGWELSEPEKILADFSGLYADEFSTPKPFQTTRLKANQFRIAFPNDIAPSLLSFLVNYIQYPKGIDLAGRQVAAVAHVTLTKAFPLPADTYLGKRARVYVPADYQDFDLVYVAVGSEFFRQSFTNLAWKPTEDGRIPKEVKALW